MDHHGAPDHLPYRGYIRTEKPGYPHRHRLSGTPARGATSVLLAGVVYDLTGSYVIPFSICGLLLIGASLASFLIRERKYSVKYQPQGTLQASTATD